MYGPVLIDSSLRVLIDAEGGWVIKWLKREEDKIFKDERTGYRHIDG